MPTVWRSSLEQAVAPGQDSGNPLFDALVLEFGGMKRHEFADPKFVSVSCTSDRRPSDRNLIENRTPEAIAPGDSPFPSMAYMKPVQHRQLCSKSTFVSSFAKDGQAPATTGTNDPSASSVNPEP